MESDQLTCKRTITSENINIITKTCPCNKQRFFYLEKLRIFKIRKIGIPYIPQFNYIKVGFKGVFIARTCFPDVNSAVKISLLSILDIH